MSVNYSTRAGSIIGIFFSIFLNMKFHAEPHGGISNEYTKHTIINIKKKLILNFIQNIIMSAAMRFFPRNSRMSLKQSW